MPTSNPRVNVTFNPHDAEILKLISNKRHLSMSSLIRKVIEDWLEDYEDLILAKRAEEAENKWIAGGCKTTSHEELCRELGIESNIQKSPRKTSKVSHPRKNHPSNRTKARYLAERNRQAINS